MQSYPGIRSTIHGIAIKWSAFVRLLAHLLVPIIQTTTGGEVFQAGSFNLLNDYSRISIYKRRHWRRRWQTGSLDECHKFAANNHRASSSPPRCEMSPEQKTRFRWTNKQHKRSVNIFARPILFACTIFHSGRHILVMWLPWMVVDRIAGRVCHPSYKRSLEQTTICIKRRSWNKQWQQQRARRAPSPL